MAQRGFTLIELLIAMAITAILAVLAYQAVQSVVMTQSSVEQNQKRTLQLQRAIWWLEQDLVQMAPRSIADGLGGRLPALSYREDLELSRMAMGLTPNAQGGLMRVGYRLESGALYRLIWPSTDRVAGVEPKQIKILDRVERMQVRLLDQNLQWQSFWPIETSVENTELNQVTLPKAVEVSLKLEDLGELKRLFRGVDQTLWLSNRAPLVEGEAP